MQASGEMRREKSSSLSMNTLYTWNTNCGPLDLISRLHQYHQFLSICSKTQTLFMIVTVSNAHDAVTPTK